MSATASSKLDTEKFRKVHRLMTGGATDGERSAARARAEAMAAKAGMSLKDAVSSLDAKPKAPSTNFFDGFDEWCEKREPGYKAKKAAEAFVRKSKQDRQRDALLKRYGSEDALFARTEREAFLEEAIAPLVTKWQETVGYDGTRYRFASVIDGHKPKFSGWSIEDITPAIREAMTNAYPWPSNLDAALREVKAWDRLRLDRGLFSPPHHEWNHYAEVECRIALLEHALEVRPAASWDDLQARFDWKRHEDLRAWVDPEDHEDDRDPFRDRLEADFAILRKQGAPEPPQPAPPRTSAEKRAAVVSMLDTYPELSDREIARRVGVSPQTVNTWRKKQ